MKVDLRSISKRNSGALKRSFGKCDITKTHYIWLVPGKEDLIYTNNKNYIPENGTLLDMVKI
jgi:hypothetical protein